MSLSVPADRSVRIAHLTDIHVQPEKNAAAGFEACLIHAQDRSPDVIMIGGDVVMDTLGSDWARAEEQWSLYRSIMKANVGTPVLNCVGNHDVWGWCARETAESHPKFGKANAKEKLELVRAYYSLELGAWHVVVLDSTHPVDGNGYTAKLDDEQFEWLADDLAKTDKPVFILSHIPILSPSAYFDGDNESSGNWHVPGAWMHIDARRIKDLFVNHPNVRLCASGHIHLGDRCEYLGVTYVCNGAVCGSWWNGPFQEFAPAYAIIELHPDGSFTNELVPWE